MALHIQIVEISCVEPYVAELLHNWLVLTWAHSAIQDLDKALRRSV